MTLLALMGHEDDGRSRISASETIAVAAVAAKYFQSRHERALCLTQRLGHIAKFSVSRFNRRLHDLLITFWQILNLLGDLLAQNTVYIIDTMPSLCAKWYVSSRLSQEHARQRPERCCPYSGTSLND